MRWTEDQLTGFQRRRAQRAAVAASAPAHGNFPIKSESSKPEPAVPRPHHQQRFTRGRTAFAKGRLKPDAMNAQEKRYNDHLQRRKDAGEVKWFKFQGMKFRLADNTFYTPDFNVMTADDVLEQHEVKGFWQDTGRVKIKVASDLYPMRFVAIKERAKKNGGGYELEEFSRPDEPVPDAPLFDRPADSGDTTGARNP